MTSEAASLRYMPGLDVARGLAIAMVLVYHGVASHKDVFLVSGRLLVRLLGGALQFGAMGVHLFFILSGFLITGILIDSRSTPDYYRNFYLRRALRIVPAYIVMLIVLKLTHSITWRYVAVCALYLCNMSGLLGARPEYGPLWSLSVEEQFYITWPFVVRNVSRNTLAGLSIALLALTPLLRLALLYGPALLRDIQFKTWVLADFFAAGSLLAIAVRSGRPQPALGKFVAPLLLGGAGLLAFLLLVPQPSGLLNQKILLAIALEPWLLFFSGLLLFFYLRPGVARSAVLRPLIFLADISYGLYLCHQFLFVQIDRLWQIQISPGLFPLFETLVRFVAEASVAIAIAWVSRRTYEKYFLSLKPRHRRSEALLLHAAEIT